LPPDSKQVTITIAATYLTPSSGHGHIENQENEPMMWQEFLNQLPIKHKVIFQHLQEGQPIIQVIMSGHVVAVSDGSFKEAQGATAWMFYDD